jgi:hypothetical protein
MSPRPSNTPSEDRGRNPTVAPAGFIAREIRGTLETRP